jgi:hypothetical protein
MAGSCFENEKHDASKTVTDMDTRGGKGKEEPRDAQQREKGKSCDLIYRLRQQK